MFDKHFKSDIKFKTIIIAHFANRIRRFAPIKITKVIV